MRFSLPSILALAVLSFATPLCAQDDKPTTDQQKTSYAIGFDIVRTLKQQEIDVDAQFLAAGIRDASTGGNFKMTADEMAATMSAFEQAQQLKQRTRMAKAQEARKAASATNDVDGKKFLEDNKAKPGVTTLADGLQYKVLTEGTGPMPKASDTVTVNYRGTLINGTEFDSSYKSGVPATFQVGGVIKGWTEILQLMKTGSKYQVFIPSELAYGERGAGADIGPGSTLIFDIDLISIQGSSVPAPTPTASPTK